MKGKNPGNIQRFKVLDFDVLVIADTALQSQTRILVKIKEQKERNDDDRREQPIAYTDLNPPLEIFDELAVKSVQNIMTAPETASLSFPGHPKIVLFPDDL